MSDLAEIQPAKSGPAIKPVTSRGNSVALVERSPHQTPISFRNMGILLLIGASLIFAFEIQAISRVNGWWADELMSIWVSDPSIGFNELINRIAPDPNQPLYLLALYWMRHLIGHERAAIVALNLTSLVAAFTAICFFSQRAGVLRWAFAAGVAFLLSGPVLNYTLEGRGYLMALCLAFVASWLCALAVEVPERRPGLLSFGIIGVLAAPIHLYAALLTGCLAAGLTGLALITRRKVLLCPGLTLGIVTSIVTALWLLLALNSSNRLSWIEPLSFQSLLAAYWEVRQLTLGSHLAVLMLVGLVVCGLLLRTTRSLTAMFALALILFLLVPTLVSLKWPILVGRYWLIGAPTCIVFVSFMGRALFSRGAGGVYAPLYQMGAILALSLFVITDVGGFFAARASTAGKSIFRGAEVVKPLLLRCPPGSIHVIGLVHGYALLSSAPENLFTSADDPKTGEIGRGDPSCAVLGWAENVTVWTFWGEKRLPAGFALTADAEELLKFLKIRAMPSEVEIYRYPTGFVVLRRGI